LALDNVDGLFLLPTFCIAEGGGFEIRLTSGNDEKKVR
jgi:hypothetical protein